jgi:hypothetical protein
VFAPLGQDYTRLCDRIAANGEPGLAWLDNMRAYGRMGDPPTYRDILAMVCLVVSLFSPPIACWTCCGRHYVQALLLPPPVAMQRVACDRAPFITHCSLLPSFPPVFAALSLVPLSLEPLSLVHQGGNPCLEQTLESYELCCLVETFPAVHDSLTDYLDTLKCALLYAKTVTLGQTHWPRSNAVMLRNR